MFHYSFIFFNSVCLFWLTGWEYLVKFGKIRSEKWNWRNSPLEYFIFNLIFFNLSEQIFWNGNSLGGKFCVRMVKFLRFTSLTVPLNCNSRLILTINILGIKIQCNNQFIFQVYPCFRHFKFRESIFSFGHISVFLHNKCSWISKWNYRYAKLKHSYFLCKYDNNSWN